MDVCQVLDLQNVSRAVERVPDDEKLTLPKVMSGQSRQIWLLNEFGIYTLILRSNKPEAKRFQKWVKEVIKTVRQTGSYSLPGSSQQSSQNEALVWKIQELEDEIKTQMNSLSSKIDDLNNIGGKRKAAPNFS